MTKKNLRSAKPDIVSVFGSLQRPLRSAVVAALSSAREPRLGAGQAGRRLSAEACVGLHVGCAPFPQHWVVGFLPVQDSLTLPAATPRAHTWRRVPVPAVAEWNHRRAASWCPSLRCRLPSSPSPRGKLHSHRAQVTLPTGRGRGAWCTDSPSPTVQSASFPHGFLETSAVPHPTST